MNTIIKSIVRPHLSGGNLLVQALRGLNKEWNDLLELYPMQAGTELIYYGARPAWIYFPNEGLVSGLINPYESNKPKNESQIAVYGDEDCVGVQALFGTELSSCRCVVDYGGKAWRCSSQGARSLLARDPASADLLMRYYDFQLTEAWSLAAVAHSVDLRTRLALWLLRTARVTGTDALPVTHDMIALRMGMRRPTVTVALQDMQKQGLIAARGRGRLDLVNLEELVRIASEAWPGMLHRRHAFIESLRLNA